jgi:hypothetical protein
MVFQAPLKRASLLLTLTGACVCPPSAEEMADLGFRTPEQAFRSYQSYLAADLVEWEYRCLSSGFKERHGISFSTYLEVRGELFETQPWLKVFADAEIVGSVSVAEDVHDIEARVAGRTVRVRLVREDSYEIWEGPDLLWDDDARFEEVVSLEPTPDGPRLTATVAPGVPNLDLSTATEFTVERSWKIDDLSEAPDAPQP